MALRKRSLAKDCFRKERHNMTAAGHRLSKKKGLLPGTLVHIGRERSAPVGTSVMDYKRDHFQEKVMSGAEDCVPFKESDTATWINVNGVHDVTVVEWKR